MRDCDKLLKGLADFLEKGNMYRFVKLPVFIEQGTAR